VVLPENEQDLERAAIRLLKQLKPEDWVQIDKDLHEHVFQARGGLHAALMTSGDITRTLTQPLIDDAISLLGQYMPIMDVAQILGSEFGILPIDAGKEPEKAATPSAETTDLGKQIRTYLDMAAPLLSEGDDKTRQSLLLVPASDMGRRLGEAVKKALPDLMVVRVPGQADLMFCREQGCLSVQELHKLMKQFRASYEGTAATAAASSHARFDIVDWLPLDP
jgi:hypothetical protein